MAVRQLGRADEARRWYAKAIESADKSQPNNRQLARLPAKAGVILYSSERSASAFP